MPPRSVLRLLVPLASFCTLSGFALAEYGYLGLWRVPFRDLGTLQLFADLSVAMLLVTSWMVRDSRTSGVRAWPYLLLTLAAGSLGPLLYLLHREWRRVSPPAAV